MATDYQIPEPILFNPLKHHLGFIRDFMISKTEVIRNVSDNDLIKELRHLGTSVMDIYSGALPVSRICKEVIEYLFKHNLSDRKTFSEWTGVKMVDYRVVSLSDGSQWTVKYHDNNSRFIHIFPARGSCYSFRVKSNTLKSALIYYIKVGKDYITGDDLNRVRPLMGLSPVRDTIDVEAIVEMIEILRD
ncbi:MAG: hypothetical protein A2X05_10420 [Bacteroidetes bacterium GWE2_41_25]|nr:MAG: hypothetical protein A2X03_08155 [Bacteroidetes bacterium GWA2_40_15]OFX98581.1 MAG: hypothetical protein A2X06_03430 [Bacteroidetes bacterium GWC2_40_22]OFY12915.1 MAG: hypothetical protein A2X05_10420 [Bacteroidetes bacterium GWE2_41_25]OFY58544.1 MAG: hypothetical protein A2X04_10195 [Bacteroidetes bacterium GWF2_41_9]HAM09708.1 hypothetical protein [Bacteroidales bacterium]